MFKNTIALFLCSFFTLIMHSQNNLQIKVYQCYRTINNVVVDGDVYDNVWKSVPWSDFFNDIEHPQKPQPYLQTRMKMLWDNNYLYIAAEIEEDNIWATLNNHDQIIYRDNDFEVFIDPDGDGLNYFEIEINAFETILDLFLPKPYDDNGHPDLLWNAEGLKKAVKCYGTINDTTIKDTKWTVELAIPWTCYKDKDSLVKRPDNNDSWRINFSRVQWEAQYYNGKYNKTKDTITGSTLPENNWTWSPQGVINMHLPDKWGKVTFKDTIYPKNIQQWTDDGYPRYWVWKGGKINDILSLEKTLRTLDDAGIHGLLYRGSANDIKKIIPLAHQYNIKVHAWFWTMNRGDAQKEWLSVNQEGYSLADKKAYVDYYKFMCPALPEVKDYLKQKLSEYISIDDIDGINMDYIRYVDVFLPEGLKSKYGITQDKVLPEYDYGYHPYMRELFLKKYGKDPLALNDTGDINKWEDFRLLQLDSTVAILRNFIWENNISVSADVFPTPEMSSRMVRQDWKNWKLDCYFPMVYHNFYNEPIEWIEQIIKEDINVVSDSAKVFCGIYLPALKDSNNLYKAINAALKGGANGVAFFNYNNLDENMIKQIKQLNAENKSPNTLWTTINMLDK